MTVSSNHVGVVVGMKSEAALLPDGDVLCGAGIPLKAADQAGLLLRRGARALASFGIAGGLDPDCSPGTLVIGSGVAADGRLFPTDEAWRARLFSLLPGARTGLVAEAGTAVSDVAAKAALWTASGAVAVDLESAAVAAVAAKAGVPFAILRAIADPAWRALPASALVGLGEDGETRPFKVALSLFRRPGDLPGLIRLGRDVSAALGALRAARRVLGAGLGFEEL